MKNTSQEGPSQKEIRQLLSSGSPEVYKANGTTESPLMLNPESYVLTHERRRFALMGAMKLSPSQWPSFFESCKFGSYRIKAVVLNQLERAVVAQPFKAGIEELITLGKSLDRQPGLLGSLRLCNLRLGFLSNLGSRLYGLFSGVRRAA